MITDRVRVSGSGERQLRGCSVSRRQMLAVSSVWNCCRPGSRTADYIQTLLFIAPRHEAHVHNVKAHTPINNQQNGRFG